MLLSRLFVVLISIGLLFCACSKKDVTQGEPGFTVSDSDAEAVSQEKADESSISLEESKPSELNTIYFDFDSYALSPASRNTLKSSADWLKKNSSVRIQIEGHCDERGTTEYNLALGERRANAASDYLKSLGIDKSRISIISYGEERPVDTGHDEASWAKNRRAEFVVLSK